MEIEITALEVEKTGLEVERRKQEAISSEVKSNRFGGMRVSLSERNRKEHWCLRQQKDS